ncbi:vesicle-associated protein 1-3-like isoform X2 [Andrographis paniculata]|uniref:vesicle-associated protein 1-3-like isoform X2 n=1 Tax=Andrographis paniculata TaxID=175694 RepID=UPI0021E7F7D0|nr:vesicle-associated protein 1-3-like isoform X2 [Andrographis paniculata]
MIAKVKTTNPKRYSVRPNAGIISPNSVCSITVTMQAHKEAPPDMQCRDKFLIQSAIAPHGATNKDVTQEMFNRRDEKNTGEFKLRVVYIPANPPSPVPEGDEDGASSTASSADDEIKRSSFSEAARSTIIKLKEEKEAAVKQNKELLNELEKARKQTRQGRGAASIRILLYFLLLGILVGYFIRK